MKEWVDRECTLRGACFQRLDPPTDPMWDSYWCSDCNMMAEEDDASFDYEPASWELG